MSAVNLQRNAPLRPNKNCEGRGRAKKVYEKYKQDMFIYLTLGGEYPPANEGRLNKCIVVEEISVCSAAECMRHFPA